MILSLAELAKPQERSDDSSIVNNYYFVTKRQGKCIGSFLNLHLRYRSTHACWKKCLAPCIGRVVPTAASCSRFVLSCVICIHVEWKKILFILVVLSWASNQYNVALLWESLYLSLQVINLYSVVIHPMNPHIVLLASMRCLL